MFVNINDVLFFICLLSLSSFLHLLVCINSAKQRGQLLNFTQVPSMYWPRSPCHSFLSSMSLQNYQLSTKTDYLCFYCVPIKIICAIWILVFIRCVVGKYFLPLCRLSSHSDEAFFNPSSQLLSPVLCATGLSEISWASLECPPEFPTTFLS